MFLPLTTARHPVMLSSIRLSLTDLHPLYDPLGSRCDPSYSEGAASRKSSAKVSGQLARPEGWQALAPVREGQIRDTDPIAQHVEAWCDHMIKDQALCGTQGVESSWRTEQPRVSHGCSRAAGPRCALGD